MASLACAFELTRRQGYRDYFDIIVYQMGHRLGGKGASSINPALGDRVEEHGLHVFWGFYDNALRMMRECYQELGRPPTAPLATIEQAFFPHDLIVTPYRNGHDYDFLRMPFPRNSRIPGDGRESDVDGPELLGRIATNVIEAIQVAFDLPTMPTSALDTVPSLRGAMDVLGRNGTAGGFASFEAIVGRVANMLLGESGAQVTAKQQVQRLLVGLEVLRKLATSSIEEGQRWAMLRLLDRLRDFCRVVLDPARRPRWLRELVDFGLTAMRGLLVDGLAKPPRNWHALDDESMSAWLARHGALPDTIRSPFLEGVRAAGYMHGHDLPAGTMLHIVFRILFGYAGAVLYKMRAGMGETVIAPLYEVLRRRGVQFRFFHAVERLELSADRSRIASILLTRQASVRQEPYRPLVDVQGLPCWPHEPHYDQLVDGDVLRERRIDFENWWTDFPGAGQVRLEEGHDFDIVVLGLSLGSLRDVCAELIADETKPAFRTMVENVRTVATQSAQLWMRPDSARFGVESSQPSIVIPFAQPMDTWADMSHLLTRERWPDGCTPGSLHYLTARLDDEEPVPPRGPNEYPARQVARIRNNLITWFTQSAGGLWPEATLPDDPQALNPYWLHDPQDRDGWARLDAQYISPLQNPSNRYVVALPGTTKYRLRPAQSGYGNLVLAGDWTRTSLSFGAVEGAVISGIGAANAIDSATRRPLGDWLGNLEELGSNEPRPTTIPEVSVPFPPAREVFRSPRRDLPRYVRREGELLFPPPVDLNIDVTTFALRADQAALQRLMDQFLDRSETVYRVLGPTVIVYAARVDNFPTDDRVGWVPELDFGVWVPALAGSKIGGRFQPQRLVTWNPFLWVDDALALLNGRLYFGFPKDLGWMTIEGDDPARRRFSLETQVIPKMGPRSLMTRRPLLAMHPADCRATRGLARGHRREVRESMALMRAAARELSLADGFKLSSMLVGMVERGLRLVFFKQMPDSVDPHRAVYQGIVETDILIQGAAKHQRLPGQWDVDVYSYDSHHISEALGLDGIRDGRVLRCDALWAMRSVFAARAHRGDVIWESRRAN